MAEKKYKYVSVCNREKPIQTNNRQQFIVHVASCPTCKKDLPTEILKGLNPEISQITAERAKGEEEPSVPGPEKIEEKKPPVDTDTGKTDVEEEEVAEETPPDEAELQKQFDGHLKGSPVFQGIQKSVNGLSDQIASLPDTLIERMTGGTATEGEVVDVEKVAEEEKEEPPKEEKKESPGKVLSAEEEKTQAGGGSLAGQGRPNPFASTEKIPAAMREDYKAGEKRKGKEEPVNDEPPPEEEEPVPDEESPKKEPVSKGANMPDLTDPKEIEALEAWITNQKAKMGGAAKPTPEPSATGVVKPFMGDLTEMIREGRSLVKAWKGEEERPPAATGGITEAIKFAEAMNKFNTSSIQNLFQMMRVMREGEKIVYSSPVRETPTGPSLSPGPTGEHVSS